MDDLPLVDLPKWSAADLSEELATAREDLHAIQERFREGRIPWEDYASQARTLRTRVEALEAELVSDDLQDEVGRTHPL